MKLKVAYILIIAILFLVLYLFKNQIIDLFFSLKEKQTIESVVEKYISKVKASLKNDFEKNNLSLDDFEMGILAFKKEQLLRYTLEKMKQKIGNY